MKRTYRKVKQFAAEHDEQIWIGGIIALNVVIYAACGVVIRNGIKKYNEQESWIQEQNFAGKAVYRLANGKLLAVTQEQVS